MVYVVLFWPPLLVFFVVFVFVYFRNTDTVYSNVFFVFFLAGVTTAHTKVVGSQVDRIIMQASMQSRCYEPKIATRHVIGDWLIGPVQRLNDGTVYTQERSQQEYNQLIKELSTFAPDSQVAQTFLAKAYGWKQKGASMFEMHP
jgi:hypothetical protein|tara:strand:- start:703 stop:1134 length:432 start_codon:yes stop_codon:yes gene_type:complete